MYHSYRTRRQLLFLGGSKPMYVGSDRVVACEKSRASGSRMGEGY